MVRARFVLVSIMTLIAGCGRPSGEAARAPASESSVEGRQRSSTSCTPLETRAAHAPAQRPSFPGQTRACAATSNVSFEVAVLAKNLEHPWAVEPLPGGDLLIT